MRLECLPIPTEESGEQFAFKFETRANFPNCLRAVNGKHIRIVHPLGSMYYNYKGYSSVVLMAVVDSDYIFIYVDIGSYGKDCDSMIFQKSSLWKSIESNEQQLPTDLPTRNTPATTTILLCCKLGCWLTQTNTSALRWILANY